MKNFNWQKEESERLSTVMADTSPMRDKNNGGWRLLFLLGVLILIAGGLYWLLDRRVEAKTTNLEADVMAAFRVWQQSLARSDKELFNTLLAGAEPAWAGIQRSQFDANLLLDRSQLYLAPVVEDGRLKLFEVEARLAPDLLTAEISFEQMYNIFDQPVGTSSAVRQIRLQQNLTFRRIDDRWVLAPRPDSYWGEWRTEEKSMLTLSYPERDEGWALLLAEDLNLDLLTACGRLPSKECSERETIEMRLETKRTNPVLKQGWRPALSDGRIIVIPTFSLVGRPVDEEGYRMLYRVYSRSIQEILTSWVNMPIPLPYQGLRVFCYPSNGREPPLIRSISVGGWVIELPRNSIRYLNRPDSGQDAISKRDLSGDESNPMSIIAENEGLDGRWVSSSRSSRNLVDSWLIYVHDTQINETNQYVVRYPASTIIHPYYGWSKDGNWLVIVDQNFIRLIAPGYDYERLIRHDLKNCSHVY